ncbi:hypothetical protein BCR44DRAFT_1443144 [Catenaria anguillulae PL171]|uniref:Uncharacterized protein n=1 Tax=Catenaria anguillulae PL171 TaxID=765915 RepID=A0A1Y2HAX4_9FUNG|nr:hypothetical protein BCR44DRAFT_1443144 [Catenaria anguillulae PL171]
MQTMFYEFPSRDDEARFRASYHQKLRKRIKAVLAVNTITAAISFSGLTLLRFATGNGFGQPGLTSGKFTRWTILDGSDLIVNLSLLLGVLTVSSRCWQVSNKKLEAVCVMYLLLMFAAAMSTSVIQRRFNVDDRALLQLSNHRLVFSFFSVATLRLRPRVHICVVGLALVGLLPASWAVPADRKPDMLGLLLPAMLAALGSTTLCFMFESAYRRYFWLKHCTRITTTLGGKKAATAPRQPSPSPEA